MRRCIPGHRGASCLNESPSEKEGKWLFFGGQELRNDASMKAPPKRKGNLVWCFPAWVASRLNESPSEKEGKCARRRSFASASKASMKAPPKRKGNFFCTR